MIFVIHRYQKQGRNKHKGERRNKGLWSKYSPLNPNEDMQNYASKSIANADSEVWPDTILAGTPRPKKSVSSTLSN